VAPADGVASKLMVHDGQLVSIGQPVIDLVPSVTYVIANFKETQIGAMRVGQRAEIELDAFPGQKFEGQVSSLSGGTGASFSLLPADNATGNFVKVVQRVPVRIAWTSPPTDAAMRAGLSADVTVIVEK
jgi:membrane fusion protein (multidrug efflux system)